MASGGNDSQQHHESFDNAMVLYQYDRPEGVTCAFCHAQTTTSAGGGHLEQFMGTEGTIRTSEDSRYAAVYREANAPGREKWLNLFYLPAATAGPGYDADNDSATKVDAREKPLTRPPTRCP